MTRVTRVRDRRHLVDEDRGLVLSVAAFDVAGRVKAIDVPGTGRVALPGLSTPPGEGGQQADDVLFAARATANLVTPVTELVAVLTRLRGGRITRLESLCRCGPFGMRTGWDDRPVR